MTLHVWVATAALLLATPGLAGPPPQQDCGADGKTATCQAGTKNAVKGASMLQADIRHAIKEAVTLVDDAEASSAQGASALEGAATEEKAVAQSDEKFWGRRRRRRRAPPPPPPPPPPTTTTQYVGPLCSDDPVDWRSSSDNTCSDYASRNYCTSNGGTGSGWYWFWGSISSYARNGIDATQACCTCGGGKKRPQNLCEITEKESDYGMSFAFHTDTWLGCTSSECTPAKFLANGVGKVFEAVPGPAGSCHCWTMIDDSTQAIPDPKNTFLFSHVPAAGGCTPKGCWEKYAAALRIFKGGDGSKNVNLAQDPESPQHWQAQCQQRQLHLENDHALGLPTAAQLVHTLTSWDAPAAVERMLAILSVEDELSENEAISMGGGHGSPLPADLRSVVGHIASSWEKLTSEALSFLENLGISIVDVLTGNAETTILGTTFDTHNYYFLMGRFLIAGLMSKSAMKQWYMDLSGGSKVGVGPGPNTKTYYGWAKCKELLEGIGAKLEAGTAVRQNELGMQILNGVMWPDAPGGERTIFLGANRENHAFVRPLLADVLDNARGASGCDGSSCWSPEWLRTKAKQFLARESFESADFKWFTTQILHKVHMNIEFSESEARAFADYMNAVIIPIPFAESQASNWVVKTALDIPGTLAKRAHYLDLYKAAIRAKFPQRRFSDPEVHLVASAFLDSLQFAGGLSVPAVLAYVLAVTHTAEGEKWPELKGLVLDDSNIPAVLWETMRMYPAVAGFPWWEQQNGKWVHEIVNVARALGDEAVFPDPDVFKLRPLSEYVSKSIGWVDFATYNKDAPNAPHDAPESIRAPHSHRCPGKDLSFQIMVAFLQEFAAAGPWETLESSITINSFQAGPYTIKKRKSVAMCWVQPAKCVHSWTYIFKSQSGCVQDGSGTPWCSHYSYHIPGQWSHCHQVPCNSPDQIGESLQDTERVVLQAMTTCKGGVRDAKSKAACACAYANTATSSKANVQRCSALSAVAQEIGSPFGCVTTKRGTAKHCEVYAPWYANAAYQIAKSWNSISTWTTNLLPAESCYASNDRCCSQDYLTTRSVSCSNLTKSALSDDWLGMPSQLQGLFWLQKQGDSSSLISFGRTRDGCGLSPGELPPDGKYPVRVSGDRSWSFATTDGGSFGLAEAVDLVYEFNFNSASNPTFAQIIPKVKKVLGLSVPPWLLSFDMHLRPNPKYSDSVVWKRTSSVVGIGVDSAEYEAVQVIDGTGKRLQAFNQWVSYCEDPSSSGSSSPGYIWLHSYEREPFQSRTLAQELGECPSFLGWVAPPIVDAAFVLSHAFGQYSFRNVIYDPPLEKSVFDDFTLLTAVGILKSDLTSFSGRYLTPAQRMCPPTAARPLDKFRTQENLAPSEEIDTHGACVPGTTFQFGMGTMCAFLILGKVAVRDDMGATGDNTWSKALSGKTAGMTKSDYVMSFFDGKSNQDGDPIYPTMETDWTQLYYQAGVGWEDTLETKLTIDLLGTHLVTSVDPGAAPSKGGETAALVVKMNHLSGFARRAGFARWGGDMYFTADGKPLLVDMTAEDGSPQRVWANDDRATWEYAKWTFRATMMNAVTLIDHLWFSHLSMANLLATVTREHLLPSHPLRRLLSIATFGTVEVNVKAGHFLLADDQVLHRASPFQDWSAVHDAGEDTIKTYEGYFGTIMDAQKRDALHPRLKSAPFYQDAPDLFDAISSFIDDFFGVFGTEWCDASTDLLQEQGLRDFARAAETWLRQERPNRAAANVAWMKGDAAGAWTCAALRKMLKVVFFAVSGFHQHVGKVADLVRNPELVGMSWAPGETSARPRQAMQYAFVSASTGYFGVKLSEDFRPLFNGIPKETAVKAVLEQFRHKLTHLKTTINQRNRGRDMPYMRMHPDRAEVSLYQ